MTLTSAQLKSIEKLNADLQAFAKETGEPVATLYEDAWTSYTLEGVKVKGNRLTFICDGRKETEAVYDWDEVKEWLKWWRQCLRRAKKYWATDPDTLDAIANGVKDDIEMED